jgi:hypothetical protein
VFRVLAGFVLGRLLGCLVLRLVSVTTDSPVVQCELLLSDDLFPIFLVLEYHKSEPSRFLALPVLDNVSDFNRANFLLEVLLQSIAVDEGRKPTHENLPFE